MSYGFDYTGIVYDWKAAHQKCGDALFAATGNKRLFNQRADFCRVSIAFDHQVQTEHGLRTVRHSMPLDEKSLVVFIRTLQTASDKLLFVGLPGRAQASTAQEMQALDLRRSTDANIKSLTEALRALEKFKEGMRTGRIVPQKGFVMPMSELVQ